MDISSALQTAAANGCQGISWLLFGYAALGAAGQEFLRLYKSEKPEVEIFEARFWVVLVIAVILSAIACLVSGAQTPIAAFLVGAGAPALLGRIFSEKSKGGGPSDGYQLENFKLETGRRPSFLRRLRQWLDQ